jgi:hypothetical protein
MKKNVLVIFLILYGFSVLGQTGFNFKEDKKRVSIPFQLINNLVFIPVKVNGVELTFLLDSGVDETVLFSLDEQKEINLNNKETISLRGLGSKEAIEGIKSTGNTLETKGMVSKNHLLYVILDQEFNLSSHVGIPVNGIIGYPFFKNNLIEINYAKKKVYFYEDTSKLRTKIQKKYKAIPITVEGSKPYVTANVLVSGKASEVKLLADTGHSDAIWLFASKSNKIDVPNKNFDDYLGKGFSGDVLGKRAIISEFEIADFKFANPIAAFPDSTSLQHVKMVTGRLGSIGGEIFKRFSVIFDYQHEKMFLRRNSNFKKAFTYNKSGLEFRHAGMQWVKETVPLKVDIKPGASYALIDDKIIDNFKYKFKLKPVYEIANIRERSTASQSGLQVGDIIVSVNNKDANKFSLQEMNAFLKSESEKWITLVIERKNQVLKFRFQLKNIL